jgi:hypothetical protein
MNVKATKLVYSSAQGMSGVTPRSPVVDDERADRIYYSTLFLQPQECMMYTGGSRCRVGQGI